MEQSLIPILGSYGSAGVLGGFPGGEDEEDGGADDEEEEQGDTEDGEGVTDGDVEGWGHGGCDGRRRIVCRLPAQRGVRESEDPYTKLRILSS